MTPWRDDGLAPAHLFGAPLVVLDGIVPPSTRLTVRDLILAERARDPGLQRSNVGGWHSRPDLCQRDDEALRTLFGGVIEAVMSLHKTLARSAGLAEVADYRFGLQAWAMIMDRDDYSVMHDHADAHWSFVFYADVGNADRATHPRSGAIAWQDPSGARLPLPGFDYAPASFEVSPADGQMVIFPGWLPHYVHPYRGTQPRVSIAGNVKVSL